MSETTPTATVPMPSIASAIPSNADLAQLRTWVEFKHGLQFEIVYLSRAALTAIGEACTIMAYNATAKGRIRTLDTEKFSEQMARSLVKNWKNVTPRSLSKVMVLDLTKFTTEQLDQQVEFSVENLKPVLVNAGELDNFLQECSMDPLNFRRPDEEAKSKN